MRINILHFDKYMPFVALIILCYAMAGCEYFPEATFELASGSRLPKWIAIPSGHTRADVSITMSYNIKPWGRSAEFILKDENGRILEKSSGKLKGLYPFHLKEPIPGFDPGYPAYEVITLDGTTEIIEHKKMEPIFYVNDDEAVRNELLAMLGINK